MDDIDLGKLIELEHESMVHGRMVHGHLHTRPDKVPPQAKYLPNQPKYELEISHR